MMIDGNEIAFKHIKEIQGDIFQIHSNPNKCQLYVDKIKMNKSVLQRGSMTIVPFYFMQNIF